VTSRHPASIAQLPQNAPHSPLSNCFATPLRVRPEPAFHTAAWRKMLHNCVSTPLTALAGRGLDMLSEPQYGDWAQQILSEGFAIFQADGAELASSEGPLILAVLRWLPDRDVESCAASQPF
jgi:ketopantoate reductase